MRPTFLAFQTAGRAMAASRANIEITGNNIANVNTDGYSRQRVDLNSISGSGYTEKYSVHQATTGFGVEVSGVSQIRDSFLDIRFRNQNSESSKYDAILSGLTDLENIFDEAETDGLQMELSNFINQLQVFSQDPTSKDMALIVRTAAQKVTQILNIYSQQIKEVRNQQTYDLENVIIKNSFNTKVKNIADLNMQIRQELLYGNSPNELYDKRNTLIDELSGLANIKVSVSPEEISENLYIENLSIAIYDPNTGTNIPIVDNGKYNPLSVDNSTDTLQISINSSFGGYVGNITKFFTGGSIEGYLDLINGKGSYADTVSGENDFRGTLYYENAMNTFATNFASVFNDLNTIKPLDPAEPTINKPLFEANDGSGTITANNIRISADWLANSSYITTTTSESDTATGEGDNILRMISKMTSHISFNKDADPSSDVMFKGTFSEYVSALIGEQALEIELNNNFSDTATNVLDNLYAARESISGVFLDEEGINMMAFQKSYQAAARFFTVLDEAVDTIINRMGIVGR